MSREWHDKQDLDALADYVQKVWPQWFVNHISTMDVVTSDFIKQSLEADRHGLIGLLRVALATK